MNTLEAIKSRRSIRSYTGELVSDEERQAILAAGQAAPIGMGKYETMRFTDITDPGLLEKLNENTRKVSGRDMPALYGAPELIVISTQLTGTPMDNIAFSNAACVVENMSLEAVELGVGTCHIWGAILTLGANPDLVREFKLPEGFSPVCAIAIGKTEETYAVRDIPDDRIAVDKI